MGWGKAGDEAKKKVDAQAEADGIKTFSGRLSNLAEKMDTSEEKEALNKLVQQVNASTSVNERKQAINKFKSAVGQAAFKLAKNAATGAIKAMFCLALMLLSCTPASAGVLDIDMGFDKLKAASKRTRGGIAVNLYGKTKGVGYIPFVWDKKRGYWDAGIGYNAKKLRGGSIAPGLGFNLINMTHDALKNIMGDRVGFLDIGDIWLSINISTPSLDHITDRWDPREKIDIYLTYAFFGKKQEE